MSNGFVIALLGAESTGKTTLAHRLAAALAEQGRQVALVDEYLRQFCDLQGRTPRADEQRTIADEQSKRIAAAALTHDIVVADTTALMIAVYSEIVFGDTGLYASAQAAHARYDLSLLTALDLPWRADGLQRDGKHVREPVDTLLRGALRAAALPYAIVAGSGERRLASALRALHHALPEAAPAGPTEPIAHWRWICENCGDVGCERQPPPQVEGRELRPAVKRGIVVPSARGLLRVAAKT